MVNIEIVDKVPVTFDSLRHGEFFISANYADADALEIEIDFICMRTSLGYVLIKSGYAVNKKFKQNVIRLQVKILVEAL